MHKRPPIITRPGTQYTRRNTVAMMTAVSGIEERGLAHGMSLRMRAADACDGYCLDAPDVVPAGSVVKTVSGDIHYVDNRWSHRDFIGSAG